MDELYRNHDCSPIIVEGANTVQAQHWNVQRASLHRRRGTTQQIPDAHGGQ